MHLARLATGQRIVRAADDASGLIGTESIRASLAALEAETDVLQRTDAIANVAGATLGEVSSLLHEANALALANANTAGLSDIEKAANQLQMDSLVNAVDRTLNTASFGGTKLFDGSVILTAMDSRLTIPATSAMTVGQTEFAGGSHTLSDLRFGGAVDLLTNPDAAQQVVGSALKEVSTLRGTLGAFRRETIHTRLNSVQTAREKLTSADSVLRDADFALESASLLRSTLLNATSHRASTLKLEQRHAVLDLLDPARHAA